MLRTTLNKRRVTTALLVTVFAGLTASNLGGCGAYPTTIDQNFGTDVRLAVWFGVLDGPNNSRSLLVHVSNEGIVLPEIEKFSVDIEVPGFGSFINYPAIGYAGIPFTEHAKTFRVDGLPAVDGVNVVAIHCGLIAPYIPDIQAFSHVVDLRCVGDPIPLPCDPTPAPPTPQPPTPPASGGVCPMSICGLAPYDGQPKFAVSDLGNATAIDFVAIPAGGNVYVTMESILTPACHYWKTWQIRVTLTDSTTKIYAGTFDPWTAEAAQRIGLNVPYDLNEIHKVEGNITVVCDPSDGNSTSIFTPNVDPFNN